jgi:hypothetical protein
MHPADVAVTLLEQSFDGNRLGPPALEVAARLSASSRCGALVYREATDAAAIVVAELDALDALGTPDAHGATAVAVDVHEVPAATAHVGGAPARSRATSSTWIGDRVVVLHGPARRVVALDPVTSSLWALFDGTTTTTELADELADESSGDATVIAARLDATVADLVHHDLVELPEGRSAR